MFRSFFNPKSKSNDSNIKRESPDLNIKRESNDPIKELQNLVNVEKTKAGNKIHNLLLNSPVFTNEMVNQATKSASLFRKKAPGTEANKKKNVEEKLNCTEAKRIYEEGLKKAFFKPTYNLIHSKLKKTVNNCNKKVNSPQNIVHNTKIKNLISNELDILNHNQLPNRKTIENKIRRNAKFIANLKLNEQSTNELKYLQRKAIKAKIKEQNNIGKYQNDINLIKQKIAEAEKKRPSINILGRYNKKISILKEELDKLQKNKSNTILKRIQENPIILTENEQNELDKLQKDLKKKKTRNAFKEHLAQAEIRHPENFKNSKARVQKGLEQTSNAYIGPRIQEKMKIFAS